MPTKRVELLIVEDEPSVRLSLSQIFTQTGHGVRPASDGFSALCEFRRKIPDILLSDLNMPGMSGFELLSIVRRRFPGVQVIAMSGAYVGDGIPAGVAADAFYQKGMGLGALLQIVQTMSDSERQPALRRADTSPPIWIPRNGHGPTGMPYVTITCPECLRTFPQLARSVIPVIQEATCTYCSAVIRYAVVEPTETGIGEAILAEGRPEMLTPVDQRPGANSRSNA